MKGLLLNFILLLGASATYAQTSVDFNEFPLANTSTGNIGIFTIDIDNDTDTDIITTEYSTHDLVYYRNERDGSAKEPIFTKIIIDNNINGQYIDAKDINNDNLPEIVCSVPLSAQIILYTAENDNDSIIWLKDTVSSNFNGAHQVHLLDMDNDNDYDVLAAGNTSNKIQWWEKEGEQWLPHLIASDYGDPQSVVYYDFNNDSYPDIISGQMLDNSGLVNIWFSNYTDSLTYIKDTLDTLFYGAHWFEIADLNNDGLEDIVAAGYFSNQIGAWLRNHEDSLTFTRTTPVNNILHPLHVATADLDNDGDLDLLASELPSSNHKLLYYLNNNQEFTRHSLRNYYPAAWQIFPLDFDGDNDLDIVSAACYFPNPSASGKLTLFENLLYTDGISKGLFNSNTEYISVYPNPATSQATIAFFLQQPSNVTLKIYSMEGRLSELLKDEWMNSGEHNIYWNINGSMLRKGIYLCELKTDTKTIFQKIIVDN